MKERDVRAQQQKATARDGEVPFHIGSFRATRILARKLFRRGRTGTYFSGAVPLRNIFAGAVPVREVQAATLVTPHSRPFRTLARGLRRTERSTPRCSLFCHSEGAQRRGTCLQPAALALVRDHDFIPSPFAN